MAITYQDYTGNGSETDYDVTFDFLETSDVKVSINGTTKTVTADYTVNGSSSPPVLTFTSSSIPANNDEIRIYRNTDADSPKHTHQAGSSIKAGDLNNNQQQILYRLQEIGTVTGNTEGLALNTGNKNDITVNSATDWIIRSEVVAESMMADNSIDSRAYVDGSIDTVHIANDAVNADKLADSINTEIAANTAKTTNATHSGEVTGATALTIADNVVDEANLKVDNTPTNDHVLTAKSSAAGGLTWAAAAVVSPLVGFKTIKYTGAEVAYSNSWTDVTDLSITYTPTLSSSIIVLEAHLNISSRAIDQTSGLQWSNFVQQFIVTPTGGSAATVQEEQKFSTGASHQWGGNSSYAAFLEAKYHFYEEYTNSNTTEKTFKVQLKEVNGTLKVHDNSGHSYFTLKEYTP